MKFKAVISDKLSQLDYLYSVRTSLKAKLDILCEMLETARCCGVEVCNKEQFEDLMTKALASSFNPKGEAMVRSIMHEIKAKLVKECAEKGLMNKVKEVPVSGIMEDEEYG